MGTNLHSLETYLYKYLLPICFIPWDGFRSIRASLPRGDQNAQTMLWLFFGFWFVMTPLVFWFGFKIKRVVMDERVLRVKAYLNAIEIPLSDVESVRAYWWPMRHVTLRLRTPSAFGDRIWFIQKRKIETAAGCRTPLEELQERIRQPRP